MPWGPWRTETSSQPSSPQLLRISWVACSMSGTVAYSHLSMSGLLLRRPSAGPELLQERVHDAPRRAPDPMAAYVVLEPPPPPLLGHHLPLDPREPAELHLHDLVDLHRAGGERRPLRQQTHERQDGVSADDGVGGGQASQHLEGLGRDPQLLLGLPQRRSQEVGG